MAADTARPDPRSATMRDAVMVIVDAQTRGFARCDRCGRVAHRFGPSGTATWWYRCDVCPLTATESDAQYPTHGAAEAQWLVDWLDATASASAYTGPPPESFADRVRRLARDAALVAAMAPSAILSAFVHRQARR